MKKNMIVAVVATALIAGGIAFYGGMQHGKTVQAATIAAARMQGGMRQFGGRQGGGQNGGLVSGEILSKDAQSITVKLQDGGSKIVFLSPSTTIMRAATGTLSDLNVGTTVTVIGSTGADGSVAAQSVQIRPARIN